MSARTVTVAVDPPYEVHVGPGALGLAAHVLAGRRRVAIVSQAAIAGRYLDAVRSGLPESEVFLMGDGEDAKSLRTVDDLCSQLASWGLLRNDAIVALGGGGVERHRVGRGLEFPLGELTRATEEIAEGRFDTRVDESRRDELGRLGGAVNQMAAQLDRGVGQDVVAMAASSRSARCV